MDEAAAIKEAERLTRDANRGKPASAIRAAVAEAIRRTKMAFAPKVGLAALIPFALKADGRIVRQGELLRVPPDAAAALIAAGYATQVEFSEPEPEPIYVIGGGEGPRFIGVDLRE